MRFRFCLAFVLLFAVVQVAEAATIKIILRYDDYSRSSNADVEQALFDVARNIGGGVLVGVIPFPKSPYPIQGSNELPLLIDLEENKIDLLKKYASLGVVEIAVHGFSHKNNAIKKPNSEFTGLPQNTQNLLLSTAKASLEAAVGLRISSFIPPYNQYDNQTLKSLESSGYKLLSADLSGPTLRYGNLAYLPGGAWGSYPQNLKDVVLSALSKRHTDAIIISTIHPYDIVESGRDMAEFRRGSPQVSIQKLIDNLHYIKQLNDTRFMPIRELFESGEDLSPDRFRANLKLRGSRVTRYHLLPEAFNVYPLPGLYYSQDSANRMYVFQISAFVLFYGVLALLVTFITRALLRRGRTRIGTALTGAILVAGILALLVKSLSSGFHVTSAVGLACCLGVLSGVALNRWRTAP